MEPEQMPQDKFERLERKIDALTALVSQLQRELAERVVKVEHGHSVHAEELSMLKGKVNSIEHEMADVRVSIARFESTHDKVSACQNKVEELRSLQMQNSRQLGRNSVFAGIVEKAVLVIVAMGIGAIAAKLGVK